MMKSNCKALRSPSKLLLALEVRALIEVWMLLMAQPLIRLAPRGDGHPVLVFPGFATGDWSTILIRQFLKGRGYAVHGWKLGFNKGYSKSLDEKLYNRLVEIYERYGRKKVSLVGWSLGGLYARELARNNPEMVRLVISLGSPMATVAEGNNVRMLYKLITRQKPEQSCSSQIGKLHLPPPVPATSIFSQSDGVVAPGCCLEMAAPFTENIEVPVSSHCGLTTNPFVFWVLANRLAQPEGEWRPFRLDGLKSFIYRAQNRQQALSSAN